MNQSQSSLELIQGLTGNLQTFVDNTMKLRYDLPQWKKYLAWGEKSWDKTFTVAEAEVDLFPMASLIDSNAPKPKRSLSGISTWNGAIPELGHSFDLTKDDLRNIYLTQQMGGAIDVVSAMGKLENTVDMLEFGIHSRLNSMYFMAVSTGHIIIDDSNNPDGIKITDLDMRIPAANKLYAGFNTGISESWTGVNATPIKDLTDAQNKARAAMTPFARWFMTPEKWFEFITHPTVIAAVNARKGTTDATAPVFETDVQSYLTIAGIKPIEIIDEMSGLQVDGVTSNIQSWENSNVVLAPAGMLGEVKSAIPVDVGDPAVKTAYTEGGRLQIQQSFDGIKKIQSFETECSAMTVLTKAKQIYILNTERTTSWT